MADTIDAPPNHFEIEHHDEEGEPKRPLPEANSSWKVYLQPYWLAPLLSNNKLIYGLAITFWYLVQFIGCVAVINFYSDIDRLTPCDLTGDLADPKKSSEVFDMPLLMLAIWHIIEWIRTTVLLTVICIGVRWVLVWYLTVPNTLFGLVTYALVHMSYFDEDGQKCRETQVNRGKWLLVEIIAFWVLFFLFTFPFLITICMGKERADRTLALADEDSDADDVPEGN